jgi:nitrite reductase (NO-forming)
MSKIDADGTGHEHEAIERSGVSRRSLLVGSAGLTLGALAAQPGQAQTPAAHSHGGATYMSAAGGTSLSGRLYQVNPGMPQHADIAHDPADIPPPLSRREPQTVRVDLETIELEAHLGGESVFRYWTFNARVPGPFIRVRVGDTVEVHRAIMKKAGWPTTWTSMLRPVLVVARY